MSTDIDNAAWQVVRLTDIQAPKKYALNGGPFGSKLVSRDYRERGVPVIRGTNLSGESRFSFEDFVFVSEEKADELRPNNAHPGDLVFTQRGTLGQVGYIPKGSPYPRFVISQSQMKLTVDEAKAEPLFIYYYFTAPSTVQTIHNLAFSSGVPHINLDILRNFELPLPPLPTQRKIAAILSAYDALIENNTRRIKILEEMAQALYREWFVHFRFPGHEGVRLVESALGLVPEAWVVKHLSTLVETQYGYTASATETQIGPKYVRGMDINKRSYIEWSEVPYCPISVEDHARYRLSIGDVLVIRMADPGKVGIVEKDLGAVFASYLIRLHIKSSLLSPYYLFYSLLSDAYQGYITGASTGTTRKSASAGVIIDVNIVIPPKALCQLFEEQVAATRRLLNNLLDQNTNLRRTRDQLLPRLISGKLLAV
jgi:type I restriction enzyme S subunit